jgi:hypothetical protein
VATGWARHGATGGPLTGARATKLQLQVATTRARLRREGGEVQGCGAPPECGYPFIGSGEGRGGREWRATAVIGAFMAVVTGVKGVEL